MAQTPPTFARPVKQAVYDVGTLSWVPMTQPGGVGGGDGAIVDGVSSSIKATVFDYTSSNPLATQLVDSNGDPVSVGGGTQYAEDTATTAGEQVMMAGVVRNDVRGSLVGADQDRTELQVNDQGDLRVDGSAVTQPVSAASLPLPSGAATAANQLPNSHDVTVDNAAGASAVNIQDGGNSITVDGSVSVSAIAAGDNNIGNVDVVTLPALAAGTNNIGDVDVLTLPALPAGTNNIGDVDVLTVPAPLNVVGGGIEAAALRVTLASDSTGVVSVDDNGASLTVDAPVGTPVFVRLSDGASAIATLPVSAASLPLPSGAATSALQTQPGVDIGDVTINNAAGASAVNVQDGGNSLTVDGTVTANPATGFGKTITYVSVAQGAAGTTVLAAASPSNKHKILGAALVMSAAGTLKFNDGAAVDLTGAMDIAANAGFVLPTGFVPYTQTSTTNTALQLVTTTGAAKGLVVILTEP